MSDNALAIDGGSPTLHSLPDFPAWPDPQPDEQDALLRAFRSGAWGSTHGSEVTSFEREFAQAHQAEHAIALTNGTFAIVAALRAAGVGIGDEVIVPPYTFIATASAALFVGAVPVFADIDPATHLLDPEAAEAAITDRTRAIIPVHLAGNVADLDAFAEIGERHGIAIIEDAAQASGASWRGRRVGTTGLTGTFSFQSSKNLSAGEGGIVTTNDDATAATLYSLVNVGRVPEGGWYQHDSVGFNLRMTEFQGAILRTQLQHLDERQKIRNTNAEILDDRLADVEQVQLAPADDRVTEHGRHLYIFRIPQLADVRSEVIDALAAEGIPAPASGYVPLHRNQAIITESQALADRLGLELAEPHCPQAELVSGDTIWLTQRVFLGSTEQAEAVAAAITKVVRALADR